MKISSDQIREELQGIWPDLKFMVISDTSYIVPTLPELKDFLRLWGQTRLPYIPKLHECEEFAIELMSDVRRGRTESALDGSLGVAMQLNWPLGIVVGTRFQTENVNHWCNLVRTVEGWRMIEPQNGGVWIPDAKNDQIYFSMV